MEIGLFIPCYIDQFYPQVGTATLQLLEKMGLDVYYPLKQTCCGQPLANSGEEKKAIKTYENFVHNFSEYDYVVCPSGSCVYHVREHYNILEQTEDVKRIRRSTYELSEFLVDVLKVDSLNAYFPKKVGLHKSCHGLRGLKLGKSSEIVGENTSKVLHLLNMVDSIQLIALDREDECCGFGGTFAVLEPDVSVKMGESRIHDHIRNGVEVITATDMSCLMHLEGIIMRQNNKIKVMHIAEILNSNKL